MKYKFIKEYFISAEEESVNIAGNNVHVCFDSQFSQKVLSNLFVLGKPYVVNEDESVLESKIINKKKKNIIDEPKKKVKNKQTIKSDKES